MKISLSDERENDKALIGKFVSNHVTKNSVIKTSVSLLLCKISGHFRSNRKAPKVAPENFKGSLGGDFRDPRMFNALKFDF